MLQKHYTVTRRAALNDKALLTEHPVKLVIPDQVGDLQWLVAAGTLVVTADTLLDAVLTEPMSTYRHVHIFQGAHTHRAAEELCQRLQLTVNKDDVPLTFHQ